MPKGIRNTPPIPPSVAPAPVADPTSLIMLQPHGDGIQFNSYGLEIPEIVDALRLTIVHLVGEQAGITVFDEMISRQPRFDDEPDLREDLADMLDGIEA